MKKLAVVLGVAAVATFTGCRDQDYDARHGKLVQNEPKSIETVPAQSNEKPVVHEIVRVEEPKCHCAPGTKHAFPCACGAKNCACVVEKPLPPPQPPQPEYTIYVVQNGDYLAKISKKYNVTIGSIMRLNNLKSEKMIRVGQKLKLPGKIDLGVPSAPPPAAAAKSANKGKDKRSLSTYTGATREYVVKNGDTLGSVAYGNGCNIRQLKKLNNLTSDSLKIGQKLKVPVGKPAPADKKNAEGAKKPAEAPVAKPAAPAEAPKPVAAPASEATPNAAAPAEAPAPAADQQAFADAGNAAAAAEPKSASVATTTYVVREGEDLTRIAVDFGVTVSVIRELNNLGENDQVKPGQVLKLPAEAQQ